MCLTCFKATKIHVLLLRCALTLWCFSSTLCQGSLEEADKQRMPIARCRRKLGVKLYPEEPRVLGQLHDFGEFIIRGAGTNDQPGLFETRHIYVIDLVTVTMALINAITINIMCQCTVFDRAALRPLAHGAAEVIIICTLLNFPLAVMPLGNQRHHRMRS